MELNVLAFGIAKEIFGASTISVGVDESPSVGYLKRTLEQKYPRLGQLASYMVAVNNEYAGDENTISQQDEVAIIPPVSGG